MRLIDMCYSRIDLLRR